MGGAAKAVATVLTYPLQLAQCRLRVCHCNSLFYQHLIHHMAPCSIRYEAFSLYWRPRQVI